MIKQKLCIILVNRSQSRFLPLFLLVIFITGCFPKFSPLEKEDPSKVIFYQPDAPGDTKVLVTTHSTLNVDYRDITGENQLAYAKKQNYSFWQRNGDLANAQFEYPYGSRAVTQKGIFWQKIRAIRQGLEHANEYDWVLWLDADMIIANPDIKVSQIIDVYGKGKDFLITQDLFTAVRHDHVNAGSMLVRRTDWSKGFFKNVEELFHAYKNNLTPEQQAIQDLAYRVVSVQGGNILFATDRFKSYSCDNLQDEIAVIPQRTMNAIMGSYNLIAYEANFCPGDFIAHFAGLSNKKSLLEDFVGCMEDGHIKSTKCLIGDKAALTCRDFPSKEIFGNPKEFQRRVKYDICPNKHQIPEPPL